MLEKLKRNLIRTPLERPAMWLRNLAGARKRRKHPELSEIYAEGERMDAILARILKPDSNCLDVGAHIGSFLVQLIRLAPRGKHMAFEALPEKAEWLKKKFPEADVVHAAISDKPGEVTFFRNVSRSGFSGMNQQANSTDKVEEVKVRCDRLDNLVPSGRRIDFIKCDVEGFELFVFKGAEGIIRRDHPPILFEWTMGGVSSSGSKPEELFSLFNETLGYRVFLLKSWLDRSEPLTLEQFLKAMKYPFQAFNFIAERAA